MEALYYQYVRSCEELDIDPLMYDTWVNVMYEFNL